VLNVVIENAVLVPRKVKMIQKAKSYDKKGCMSVTVPLEKTATARNDAESYIRNRFLCVLKQNEARFLVLPCVARACTAIKKNVRGVYTYRGPGNSLFFFAK
jgi:hypothetical protein